MQIKHLLAVNVTPAVTSAQNEVRKISGKNSQPACFHLLAVAFFSLIDLLDILFFLLILVFPFFYPTSPVSSLISPSPLFPLSLHPNCFSHLCRLCQSGSVVILLFLLLCPRLLLFTLPLPACICVTVDSSRCHGEDPFCPPRETALAEAQTIAPSVGVAPSRQGRAHPSRSTLPPCRLIGDARRPAQHEATSRRDVHRHQAAAGMDTANLREPVSRSA